GQHIGQSRNRPAELVHCRLCNAIAHIHQALADAGTEPLKATHVVGGADWLVLHRLGGLLGELALDYCLNLRVTHAIRKLGDAAIGQLNLDGHYSILPVAGLKRRRVPGAAAGVAWAGAGALPPKTSAADGMASLARSGPSP